MVNEKYMLTHFFFLLLSTVSCGFIIQKQDYTEGYYKFLISQISFDFVSACVLAFIF